MPMHPVARTLDARGGVATRAELRRWYSAREIRRMPLSQPRRDRAVPRGRGERHTSCVLRAATFPRVAPGTSLRTTVSQGASVTTVASHAPVALPVAE